VYYHEKIVLLIINILELYVPFLRRKGLTFTNLVNSAVQRGVNHCLEQRFPKGASF